MLLTLFHSLNQKQMTGNPLN